MSYTASKSQTGQGTTISINPNAASPPTWTVIGECLSVQFSDKNTFDDATNLQSVAKEFLATLQDPGKLTVDVNRVGNDAGQVLVHTDYVATPPGRSQYKVALPINTAAGQSTAGDTYVFLAFVESLSPDVKVDKKIMSKFSLQVTGAITFTAGS